MVARRQFLGGLAVAAGTLAACREISSGDSAERPERAQAGASTELDAQALEDILVGSSYLGTGGGGSLSEARELIAKDLSAGLTFSMLPVEALADSDRVACPYGLASLAETSADMQARLDAIENRVEVPVQAAFEALERHLGQKFAGVIMGEIGPLSLAEGLSIAARLGVPALDADTVGRAVPEINQHSVKVAGIPLTPIGAATPFGDEMIVETLGDPTRAEDILRSIAVVSRECGVTDSPISGRLAKREGTLVTESLTLSRRIGTAVREAKAAGSDAIEAARAAADGYLLFTGTVAGFDWRDEDGFLVGEVTLAGTDGFDGQSFETQVKNEHLVARRNGAVVATCPDLISIIDVESGDGIVNPGYERGQRVAVLGFRSDPLWRSEAGLEVFSPRYFGYDLDYVPIEALNERAS
ncbi:hypothetical protein NAP1_11923 [Erythrobacter sp. NAP1]|uniref:DUF917 domain-containing protein n=1 Tax=Erythrobacter sp. NAP1 TaxID=237727 RepID=UPI000068798D|nr:DUF917 domain-containing protein [Erythrobacter sp. NAP1]EAQ28302.1 hypothetical protein NAP1_11923 [Erythrobacter sp. NAP1]